MVCFSIFIQNSKIYIFACILNLITRTWLTFQKYKKKNILFFLICGITNLYVKYIPDIKLKKYQKNYFVFC